MKISIIIPVYNSEDCVDRCIRSCMAQTHTDIEIIAVDDGSTDATPQMLDDYASEDPRIRVIHQENGGSSSARNAGIRSATGEYLGFVDADDAVEPDMYEKLADYAGREDLAVVQICRDEIAADGSQLPMVVTPPEDAEFVSSEDFLRELLLHKGDCSFCTKLIRRDLFDVGLFPEGELNEDFRLFTQMLAHIDGVGILPDIGYHVHYREGSNTRKRRNEFSRVYRDIVVNADRMETLCEERYPGLSEYARRFALVQRLDYMLHIPVHMMDEGDEFYRSVRSYLREHRDDIKSNPYLSDDQRSKLRLLAAAPKTVRRAHGFVMKLREPGTVAFILTVVIVMIAAVVCCYRKSGMHEDEFYSYYSSNRTYGMIAEGSVSRDTVLDELRVRQGEGFNFGLVKEVQSWDVHPPLYYFVLHLVCSLTPGVFSMWQGLGINLVCLCICMILMWKLGEVVLSGMQAGAGGSVWAGTDERARLWCGLVVCAAILAWGVSAATLTGVVFIRMYMLLTVWILAVTLLHISPRIRVGTVSDPTPAAMADGPSGGRVSPWFWPVFGVLTFAGFMTHYYFFIWLFFLAAAWNIREIVRTKSVRTTLCYGATMIVTFGLCYLFYPAFPAQMFRGQRGAQATGTFLDLSNTGERMGFFAERINRIGFGGILWVLIGLLAVLCLLNIDRRRGPLPKIARWTADERTDRVSFSPVRYDELDPEARMLIEGDGQARPVPADRKLHISDAGILIVAVIGYFLVVSKTALMLGDSSIRYVMPVLGILYLCLTAGLAKGVCGVIGVFPTLRADGARTVRVTTIVIIVILCLLAGLNIVSDTCGFVGTGDSAGSNISFLYPETAAHRKALAAYPDADVVYVYPSDQSWVLWSSMTELLDHDSVTYITSEEFVTEYGSDPHRIPGAGGSSAAAGTVILYLDHGITVPAGSDMTMLYTGEYCDVYIAE